MTNDEPVQLPFVVRISTFIRHSGGLTGWSVDVDSIEAMLAGGVAMATPGPEEAGREVHTGHRFTLQQATAARCKGKFEFVARKAGDLRLVLAEGSFSVVHHQAKIGWIP